MPKLKELSEHRTRNRRDDIAKRMNQYIEARDVIEWLKDNHLLGEACDPDELARDYAFGHSQQKQLLDYILVNTKVV